jgi:hypothetical protein
LCVFARLHFPARASCALTSLPTCTFFPHTSRSPLQVLQEKIASRFKNVRDSFNFYNSQKDGSINEREFRDRLVCIGLDMTEPEYRKLYRHFDKDCDGQISYYEWNNVVGGLIYPLSDISLDRPESPNRIKEYTHRAMGRGLEAMVHLEAATPTFDPVEAAFREINTCRSGLVSHQEFVQVRWCAAMCAQPLQSAAPLAQPLSPPLLSPATPSHCSCSSACACPTRTTRRPFAC